PRGPGSHRCDEGDRQGQPGSWPRTEALRGSWGSLTQGVHSVSGSQGAKQHSQVSSIFCLHPGAAVLLGGEPGPQGGDGTPAGAQAGPSPAGGAPDSP
ncbi:unnamed protein product, partial [Rangifer tarandus platyrhynchus]